MERTFPPITAVTLQKKTHSNSEKAKNGFSQFSVPVVTAQSSVLKQGWIVLQQVGYTQQKQEFRACRLSKPIKNGKTALISILKHIPLAGFSFQSP